MNTLSIERNMAQHLRRASNMMAQARGHDVTYQFVDDKGQVCSLPVWLLLDLAAKTVDQARGGQ